MKINGKQIKLNQHFTHSEIEYLRRRIESLVSNLENKGYDVSVDHSSMSEASYVTVNDNKISFRNHEYFYDGNHNEYTVWLDRFNTWSEAKKYFFNMVIPQINGYEIQTEKEEKSQPTTNELIANAKKQLENATNDAMKTILEGRIKHLEAIK